MDTFLEYGEAYFEHGSAETLKMPTSAKKIFVNVLKLFFVEWNSIFFGNNAMPVAIECARRQHSGLFAAAGRSVSTDVWVTPLPGPPSLTVPPSLEPAPTSSFWDKGSDANRSGVIFANDIGQGGVTVFCTEGFTIAILYRKAILIKSRPLILGLPFYWQVWQLQQQTSLRFFIHMRRWSWCGRGHWTWVIVEHKKFNVWKYKF